MRFDFRPLPGMDDPTPRPLLDVRLDGLERGSLVGLVDSGALHNRFGTFVARQAAIDLDGAPPESIALAGRVLTAHTVTVGLQLGEHRWEAPVSFCDPWPWDFQLLGQEGFLRWFRVTFQAADRWMDVEPTS